MFFQQFSYFMAMSAGASRVDSAKVCENRLALAHSTRYCLTPGQGASSREDICEKKETKCPRGRSNTDVGRRIKVLSH